MSSAGENDAENRVWPCVERMPAHIDPIVQLGYLASALTLLLSHFKGLPGLHFENSQCKIRSEVAKHAPGFSRVLTCSRILQNGSAESVRAAGPFTSVEAIRLLTLSVIELKGTRRKERIASMR